MPNDSQGAGASVENEEVLNVTPPDDSSSSDDVEANEPDLSELRRAFNEVKTQTATRAEIDSLKRQAGHVPALQKQIASLEAKLAQYDSVQSRLDAYELMLLDVLPTESAERVEAQRQARTQEQILDEKLKPLLEKFETKAPDEEPEEANFAMLEFQARVEAATNFVKTQAQKAGVDPDSIPPEVWVNAQQKHGLDLEQASLEVLKYVNEQAQRGSASDRRTERKEAASGGNPAERSGAMGQYDMTTLKGAAQARKDGAITSEEFMEVYKKVQRGL